MTTSLVIAELNGVSTENGAIKVDDPKKYKTKFKHNNESKSIQCNSSTWQEFYSEDFGSDVYFEEVVFQLKNNHMLKIEIDDEVIVEFNINDLEDIVEDD